MNTEAGLRERVRQLVERSPGTQSDFAFAIGLDKVKLSKSLSGSRQFTSIEVVRIAKYCEVSADWLLYGDAGSEDGDPYRGDRASTVELSRMRDRILASAWDVLTRKGYEATQVVDVAMKAGVTPAKVNYFFLTRDELLNYAMHRKFSTTFDDQWARLVQVESARERLMLLIEMQLPDTDKLTDDWSGWVQLWSWGDSRTRFRQLHCEIVEQWNESIEEIVVLGQKQGHFRKCDPTDAAMQLTALVNGLGLQVILGVPGATADSMRRQLRLYVETVLDVANRRGAQPTPLTEMTEDSR